VFSIDEGTGFGARAAAHLRDDKVVWLTSVSPAGAPLPTPVWFIWDGASTVTVHSLATARRNDHVRANPRVTLNFPARPSAATSSSSPAARPSPTTRP
jgi:PPOX class probable F420-dependent enzyme